MNSIISDDKIAATRENSTHDSYRHGATVSFSLKKILIPALIAALLAILGYSLAHKQAAPDVTLQLTNGQSLKISDLKGKIVLVNFWATDCPGCIAEMPSMIETYKRYHDKGFEVLAVAMPYDPIDQVKSYSEKNALPFKIAHDDSGNVSTQFDQVRVTPTAFLLDQQGNIIRKSIGELDFAALHRLLDERLLKKG